MSNTYVRIQGIVSNLSRQKIFLALKRNEILDNCLLFFFDYSEFDIPIGEEFKYFVNKDQNICLSIHAKLKSVTQNQCIVLDCIPSGHKTICEICFDQPSLEILLSNVPLVDSWEILPHALFLSNSKDIM